MRKGGKYHIVKKRSWGVLRPGWTYQMSWYGRNGPSAFVLVSLQVVYFTCLA